MAFPYINYVIIFCLPGGKCKANYFLLTNLQKKVFFFAHEIKKN